MMRKLTFILNMMFLTMFIAACGIFEETPQQVVTEEPAQEQPQETPAEQPTETPAENGATNLTPNVETSPAGCKDSDNGLNTVFAGDVVDKDGQKVYDKCQDSNTLVEAKCAKDGTAATSKVGCLYGCVDGACNKPPQEETGESSNGGSSGGTTQAQGNYTGSTAHCTDNDGGETYDLKGTCGDASSSNLNDFCIGTDTLVEWACHRTQDKCVQLQYSCTCSAGACQ